MTTDASPTNVVRFRQARSAAGSRADQRSLMDAIYGAGSLPIAAEDHATKAMATRLTIFGFVQIDEVHPNGTMRRLRPSEAIQATSEHPWRVSRSSAHYACSDDLFAPAFKPTGACVL